MKTSIQQVFIYVLTFIGGMVVGAVVITLYHIFGKPTLPEADMSKGRLPEWIEPCEPYDDLVYLKGWDFEYPPMGENDMADDEIAQPIKTDDEVGVWELDKWSEESGR